MSAPRTRRHVTVGLQAVLAGLALAAACTRDLPQRSDGAQPDCTGLAVPTVGCLVGTPMLVCVLDGTGHPEWSVTCSGGNTGGAGSGGAGGGGAGGAGGTGGSTPTPFPVTFALENGGATSVFIFVSCSPELTITELSTPPVVIGLAQGGCGICDCAQATCPPVTCGPCFQGGLEIPAGGAQQYFWDPVDLTYEARGSTTCSQSRILPPGHYRVDVPVYADAAAAAAKGNGWLASQTFDLPATDTVVVQLATGAP